MIIALHKAFLLVVLDEFVEPAGGAFPEVDGTPSILRKISHELYYRVRIEVLEQLRLELSEFKLVL